MHRTNQVHNAVHMCAISKKIASVLQAVRCITASTLNFNVCAGLHFNRAQGAFFISGWRAYASRPWILSAKHFGLWTITCDAKILNSTIILQVFASPLNKWSITVYPRWPESAWSCISHAKPKLGQKLQIQDPKSKAQTDCLGLPKGERRVNQSKIRNQKSEIKKLKSKNPKFESCCCWSVAVFACCCRCYFCGYVVASAVDVGGLLWLLLLPLVLVTPEADKYRYKNHNYGRAQEHRCSCEPHQ